MNLKLAGLGLVIAAAAPVHAAELDLWLTGDAYEGGPAFTVRLGNTTVGTGTVDPIPESAEGTRFSFTLTDEVLANADGLYIQLTNDRFDAGVGDRNLRVLRAKLGEVEFMPSDFAIVLANGSILPARNGQLAANAQVAVAGRPAGGWEYQPPSCDLTARLTFANAAFDVPTEQQAELAALLERAIMGGCAVTITGFSSSAGPTEANQRISEARAAAVLEYLVSGGASFTLTEVTGAGETQQFGPTQADNRVVTVQLGD